MDINSMLPILIPLVIVQFGLFIYALRHVLTHDHYKTGNRKMWLILVIVCMNFVGPILYLVLGKEED